MTIQMSNPKMDSRSLFDDVKKSHETANEVRVIFMSTRRNKEKDSILLKGNEFMINLKLKVYEYAE